MLKLFLHIILIIFLTIVTQIGGIIWVFILIIAYFSNWSVKLKTVYFLILYLILSTFIVPNVAPYFGRIALPVFSHETIKPNNLLFVIANRHYVRPSLFEVLQSTAKKLEEKEENIQIIYLDANFPFLDGFPLLPHRSHNDGKKIDISFVYQNEENKPINDKRTMSGYGAFVEPEDKINNSIQNCLNKGYYQYDYPKYMTFGTINGDLELDLEYTRFLVKTFNNHPNTQKIFIEPHLKSTLNVHSLHKIRYHGCAAVRHDDHIHLQVH